jgi:hypothetical protein
MGFPRGLPNLPSASLLAGLLFLSTAAIAQVDYDRSVDFSRFATYALTEGTPAPTAAVQGRIESAIRFELEVKGLVEAEFPDLWVVTHVSVGTELSVSATTFGYGGYPGWGGWTGWGGLTPGIATTSVNVNEIPKGELLVDLVDAESGELVWRGIASGTVKSSPDRSERQINKKVKKMFRDFPPGSK